jgi:YggT family protein
MSSSYFINPLIFIINVLFSFYILAVMLRLLLQWVRANFYNPVAKFLVTLTQPLIHPLRRFLPPIGNLDTASIVLLLVLTMIKLAIISSLVLSVPPLPLLLLASVGDLISLAFDVFKIAIILQVILSWLAPATYNPATILLFNLTEPLLRPVRNLVPPMGGLDLSPLVVLLGLQVVSMLIEPLFPHII